MEEGHLQGGCHRAEGEAGQIIMEDRKDSESLLPESQQVWPLEYMVEVVPRFWGLIQGNEDGHEGKAKRIPGSLLLLLFVCFVETGFYCVTVLVVL